MGSDEKDGSILDRGTGLSRRAIRVAIDSLVERNILIKQNQTHANGGHAPTVYALHVKGGVQNTLRGRNEPQPLGTKYPHKKEKNKKQEEKTFRKSSRDFLNDMLKTSDENSMIEHLDRL